MSLRHEDRSLADRYAPQAPEMGKFGESKKRLKAFKSIILELICKLGTLGLITYLTAQLIAHCHWSGPCARSDQANEPNAVTHENALYSNNY